MNRLNERSAGRVIAGYLLGLLLAFLSPMCLLTELLSLMPVVLLSSVALVFIRRWSGLAPAVFAALMQLVFAARYAGEGYFWFFFFLCILPLPQLWRSEKKPFFEQVRRSIFAFGTGTVLSVFSIYSAYGGNTIERALLQLPNAARRLNPESLQGVALSYSSITGLQLTSEGFIQIFDELIARLIPVYQLNLPGLIFSGALITAVVCAALNARMLHHDDTADRRVYVSLRHWALPASATCGLLMITLISFVMSKTAMKGGAGVFHTVLCIAVSAFSIQTIASAARRLHASKAKGGTRKALIILLAALCLFGAYSYAAVYGCASAIFGSKGALRQYAQNRADQSDHDSSNDV